MSETKLIKRAKVTLKGAKTYSVNGQKFIKDTAVIVKGSMVEELRFNGRFKFTELEAKEVKKKLKSSSSNGEAVSKNKKKNKKKASKKVSKKSNK